MTRFTTGQIAATISRDLGLCMMSGTNPGCTGRGETANHRLNDGMGGSPLPATLANACAICHACNGIIESDAALRDAAIHLGVKLTSRDDIGRVPYRHPLFGWMLPTDDGTDIIGRVYLQLPAQDVADLFENGHL